MKTTIKCKKDSMKVDFNIVNLYGINSKQTLTRKIWRRLMNILFWHNKHRIEMVQSFKDKTILN